MDKASHACTKTNQYETPLKIKPKGGEDQMQQTISAEEYAIMLKQLQDAYKGQNQVN